MSKPIVYIDMDGVLVDFQSGVNKLSPEVRAAYEPHCDNVPGIFATMDPMPGAVQAYKQLFKRFDVFVLSKPPHKSSSAYSDKRDWIAKHLGEHHTSRLILSPVKHLSIGDFLIDDRPVPLFRGKQLLFGSEQHKDWTAVLEFFDALTIHGDD